MRRILVAGSSLVVLALVGVLAAGVGAQTVGTPPAASHRVRPRMVTPRVLPHLIGGSTCFVSAPRCSQTPCVELIGSDIAQPVGSVAAVGRVQVLPARPVPSESCGKAHPPTANVIVNRPAARPPDAFGFAPRLRAMAAQLAARHR